MESIINDFDVYCIEWDNITGGKLVIQRDKIQDLLGKKLITLGENKSKLFDHITQISPDIIHLQEIPEHFISYEISKRLYDKNRPYIIVETSHDSSGDPRKKLFFPDKFMFVSKWQIEQYKSLNIPSILVEYPIEYVEKTKTREELLKSLKLDPNKKHIINVGLFTPRKNQAEVIEYARMLKDHPIQFHFIGNQADNFKYYWEPLMKNLPKNCKIWGERNDVNTFYQMADLMLFTSRGTNNDKETSPLVIREAISNRTPSLIYNLVVYLGMYNNYDNLKFLNFDNKKDNLYKILKELNIEPIETYEVVPDDSKHFYYETRKGREDLLEYNYERTCNDILKTDGEGPAQYWSIFHCREMDNDFIKIEPGDVFFDLGANIGMSSKYAQLHGASEIHCFEPDPSLYDIIRKNIPNAIIYLNAIDNEEKEIELYHWPYNPVNIGPKYKTHTINLRNILRLTKKPINYMKIDIEGFEEHLFDDVTISEMSKVEKIFIECHFKDTTQFCETIRSKGFDLQIDAAGLQTMVYAKNTTKTKDDEVVVIPISSNIPKKIHIIDAYATTNDKLDILRKCIASVRKMGNDIMLVSHCSFPEDIVNSVQYHIFDSDNTFNSNNVFGFRVDDNFEINRNITKSHEFTIIRAIRLAFSMAQQLRYKFFQFTEFDHIYSNEDAVEIYNLEQRIISEEKEFLFFKPPSAQFGSIVGEYFESCFFMGYIDEFIHKFNDYFPETIEEYNKEFAIKFPNCLEYFFYQMFKDEDIIVIDEYVKSYFKNSDINLSSWSNSDMGILMDDEDNAYLVIVNNDNIDHTYEITINGKIKKVTLKSNHDITKLYDSVNIQIKIYSNDRLIETKNIDYNKKNHHEYKALGSIKIRNKQIFEKAQPKEIYIETDFDETDNKLNFSYLGKTTKKVLISIKDIDSKACIYGTYWDAEPGARYWVMPLPKIVIDFYTDPKFGGFLIEFRENDNIIQTEEIRIKTLPYVKPIMDLSNTEPIFMNYYEFFDDKIYDDLDIKNRNIVFDIGANIGLWTAYILNQGAKKVYAFEPNKLAIDQLNHNFSEYENVEIIPKGVYYKRTKIPFYIDSENSLISSVVSGNDKVMSYEIDTVTINEMILKYNINEIDLLKMDIEGAEFDIFDNISKETISKINSMLIEYHDFYFADGSHKVDNLVTQLENFGYMVTRPVGVKYIFATKTKRKYWVNKGSTTEIIEEDLFDGGKAFTWGLLNEGKCTGYHHQYREMYFTNGCVYERYGCKIEKGDVVVDAGANIGMFANVANEKGAQKIYCFEPGDLAYSCLEKNAPENAELFKVALGNVEGLIDLSLPSEGDTMSGSCKFTTKIKNTAPMTTINKLFSDGIIDKIDFLKIDAEGSEVDIIDGISDENLKKVKKISMEYHSNILGNDLKGVIWKRLTESGFKGDEFIIDTGIVRIFSFWRE